MLNSFLIGCNRYRNALYLFFEVINYVLTYTFKKKEVDMNVVRSYSNEGKNIARTNGNITPNIFTRKDLQLKRKKS